MKYTATIIALFVCILAIGCHSSPCYFCQCTNTIHRDSNISEELDWVGNIQKATADSMCRAFSTAHPIDTCTVIIQKKSVPM